MRPPIPNSQAQKSHEMARREADEMWSLVDEYSAMADRAEKRAEAAWEKLQESKPPSGKLITTSAAALCDGEKKGHEHE